MTEHDATPRLLTADEVGECLKLSGDAVRRFTRANGWPYVLIGPRKIRYTPEHVEAIIAMHTKETGQAVEVVGLTGQTARSRRRSA
jgi:hypothetical protein